MFGAVIIRRIYMSSLSRFIADLSCNVGPTADRDESNISRLGL